MAFETENLGEAKVKVTVDNSQTDAGLKEAESKVGTFAKNVSSPLRDATRTVTQFFGAFTAAAAVATTFFKIGQSISENIIAKLRTAKERMEDLKESFEMGDEAGNIKKATKDIDELQKRLAEIAAMDYRRGVIAMHHKQESDRIREQVAQLRSIVQENRKIILDQEEIARREAAIADEQKAAAAETKRQEEDAIKAARERASVGLQLDVEMAQSAEERATIIAVAEVRAAQAAADAAIGEAKREYEAKAELLIQLNELRIKLAREQDEEDKRREEEAAQRERERIAKEIEQAQKLADAQALAARKAARDMEKSYTDAFRRVREQAKNLFPAQDIAFQAGQINEALSAIRAQNPVVDMTRGRR